MGDLNHYLLEGQQLGHEQPRRFVEGIDDNILTQMIKDLMKGDALLDLTLSNKEKLQGKVESGGSLSCTHREVVKFRIMRRNTMAKTH